MAIITPPAELALQIGSWQLGQQRYDITEQSDGNGHTATRLGAPPRWRLRMGSVPALLAADAARWKATVLGLRGRINHLAMWDVTNPVPRGTARGSLTLAATAAAGAASVQLVGASGTNLVRGGSFEVDTNSDGLADEWLHVSTGSVGTRSFSLSPDNRVAGASSQVLGASALAAGTGNYHSAYQVISVAHAAGRPVALAGWFVATPGTTVLLELYWRDSGGSAVAGTLTSQALATGGSQLLQASGVCPPNAVTGEIFAYQRDGVGGPAAFYLDGVHAVVDAETGVYPPQPNLLQGDWLQIGTGVASHYCMVTADATATDAGAITVSIEPPLRQAIASNTAVTWNKPVAHYKLTTDSQAWQGVPGSSDVGGFALDLLEDWRP